MMKNLLYIISPARTFSTITGCYINLPKNCAIFTEPRFDYYFCTNNNYIRISEFTKLNFNKLEEYKRKILSEEINFTNFLIEFIYKNKYMKNILDKYNDNSVIGFKDPHTLIEKISCKSIDIAKRLIKENKKQKFLVVLRIYPETIIPSYFKNINKKNDKNYQLHLLKNYNEYLNKLLKLKNENKDNFLIISEDFLYKNKQFTFEKVLKELFNIIPDYNYNKQFVEIKNDIMNILNNKYLGNYNFIVQNNKIVNHHLRNIEEIKRIYFDKSFIHKETLDYQNNNISHILSNLIDQI